MVILEQSGKMFRYQLLYHQNRMQQSLLRENLLILTPEGLSWQVSDKNWWESFWEIFAAYYLAKSCGTRSVCLYLFYHQVDNEWYQKWRLVGAFSSLLSDVNICVNAPVMGFVMFQFISISSHLSWLMIWTFFRDLVRLISAISICYYYQTEW